MRRFVHWMALAATALACGPAGHDGGGDGGASTDATGGTNDVEPALIAGGGVGSGRVDGELNVHVIDAVSGAPIAGASVRVGAPDAAGPLVGVTDGAGLIVFADAALEGEQVVTARAAGHAAATWFSVDGANVTVPLEPRPRAALQTARASGSIAGWSSLPTPGFNHYNLAVVLYSFSDEFGAPENELAQPMDGDTPRNICVATSLSGGACSWEMNTRVGRQLHYAVIVDGDQGSDPFDTADDTYELIGYAVGNAVDVASGQNLSGEVLMMIPAGQLRDLSVSLPSAPAGLGEPVALPFLDLGDAGQLVFPLPTLTRSNTTTRVPAPSGTLAGGEYLVVGLAVAGGTASFPYSASFQRGVQLASQVSLPSFLEAPGSPAATQGTFSFTAGPGSSFHVATILDAGGEVAWSVVLLDREDSFTLPALDPSPLPAGAIELRVAEIAIQAFDPGDFSLAGLNREMSQVAEASATVVP